ncbi:MAG TPA: OmpA family protein [Bacteroidales bacterium]|nr:OmpA family protein [Bacteroidales bacterium]
MKKLLLILLVLANTMVFAQQSLIEKGNEAYGNYMFEIAADYYEKALPAIKTDEEKALISLKLGICYFEIGKFAQAEASFSKAFTLTLYNKVDNPELNKAEVLLKYADALRMSANYEKAIDIYDLFLKSSPNDYRAINGKESCMNAPKWITRPTRYKVTNVASFNSAKLDFAPTWASKDYRSLFFTTSRDGTMGNRSNYKSGQKFTDLFEVAQDRKNTWSEPIPVTGEVNSEFDEGASFVSSKGTEILFTRCEAGKDIDKPCRIFLTTKRGNAWGTPVEIAIEGFAGWEVGYPTLSKQGNVIVFASNKAGGYGAMDLYKGNFDIKTASVTAPMNLGFNVNTVGDEVFPFLKDDGKLYFSSDGRGGMGGLDIFVAQPDGNGMFKESENMRYPINSSYDDFGIIFKGSSEEGYFSSNRPGGKGGDDIYSFMLPPLVVKVQGFVKDTTDLTKIVRLKDATVTLLDEQSIVKEMKSDANGAYQFELEVNKNYTLKAMVDENYFANSVSFTTKGVEYDTVIYIDLNLAKIPLIIELPNIEYDLGKATLRPESTVSLDGLVKTLNDNPHITIEMRAHTDYRDTDERNQILSENRAKSCVDYLIMKGIDPERLSWKGFGESSPKVVNANDAARNPFLKEGDVLTPAFIDKLPKKDQQEAAHQLNRRTEFSVLRKDWNLEDKYVVPEPQPEENQQRKPKDKTGEF